MLLISGLIINKSLPELLTFAGEILDEVIHFRETMFIQILKQNAKI